MSEALKYILTMVVAVVLSVGGILVYDKYFKKIYVVDYTKVINQYKNEVETMVLKGDQFMAQIKIKQLQQVATETDSFCKHIAQKNKVEVYAANLVFASDGRIVDLTPQLITHLQDKQLLGKETNASK